MAHVFIVRRIAMLDAPSPPRRQSRTERLRLAATSAAILLWTAGCGQPVDRPSAHGPAQGAAGIDPSRARLRLAEIMPAPVRPIASAMPGAPPTDAAIRLYRDAEARFAEGHWPEAIEFSRRCLSLSPDWADARLLAARASLQAGDSSAAEAHLRAAARATPDDVRIHQLLGEIAWRDNRAAEAIDELRLALVCSDARPDRPETVLAHLSLAMALRKEGYLTAAIDELEIYLAAAAAPSEEMTRHAELMETVAAYRGRAAALVGEMHTLLGQHEAASDAYRRAAVDRPDDFSIVAELAHSLARSGRAEDAIAVVHNAADRLPKALDCIRLMDQVCSAVRQPDRAKSEIARLAERFRESDQAETVADELAARGLLKEAAEVLDDVARRTPSDPRPRLRLAELRLKMGDAAGCEDAAVRALKDHAAAWRKIDDFLDRIDDDQALNALCGAARASADARSAAGGTRDEAAAFLYGKILLRLGRSEAAETQFRVSAQAASPNAAVRLALAEALAARKKWEAAEQEAEAAVQAGVNTPNLHVLLGRIQEALDKPDAAEQSYRAAVREERRSAAAWRGLARLAERKGDARRCEEFYRTLIDDLDDRDVSAREALIRLYVNTNRIKKAQEEFAEVERLGLTGPQVERCRALVALAGGSETPTTAPGAERLKRYRDDLRDIIARYPADVGASVDLAMTHLALGEYEDALAICDAAASAAEDDDRILELRAGLLRRLLRYEEAEEATRRLLAGHPRSAPILEQLADLAMNRADFDAAERQLRALIARDDLAERRPAYFAQLVDVLTLMGRVSDAIELARALLDEAPADPANRERYLRLLGKAGRHDDAIAAAAAWLGADPASERLRRLYLSRLQAAGRHVDGQHRVLEWLAADPDDAELNGMLIVLLWGSRSWADAEAVCRIGMEIPDEAPVYRRWLAQTCTLSGRYDEAIAVQRGLLQPPTDEDSYLAYLNESMELIGIYVRAERFDDAERAIAKLLSQLMPRGRAAGVIEARIVARLRRLMANVYQLTDRLPQAIEELEAVYEANPADRAINNDLGYVLADHGMQLERAGRMIRLAVGQEPRNAAYVDSLGWYFYKCRNFSEAAKWLDRAIRFDEAPDAVLFDHLGDALYRSGREAEAAAAWRRAAALLEDRDPTTPPDPDQRRLAEAIRRKIAQSDAGTVVDVAPVGEKPATRPAG